MPPQLRGLEYIEPLPDGVIPVQRGEVVALQDDPEHDFDGDQAVEYGIIRSIGIKDGQVYLDLEVYDSRTGYVPPAEGEDPELRRVPFEGGIQ